MQRSPPAAAAPRATSRRSTSTCGALRKDLPPIEFDYRPTPLTVTDTGHSFQVNATPGSGGITIGGEHYDLVQLHFHRPSEETFQGHHYSMVAHLVHKNARGELAVVAVQIHKGQENAFLKPIFDNFPAPGTQQKTVAGVSVDPGTFVPAGHGYYTYEGSLTTPPCSEGVRWFRTQDRGAGLSRAAAGIRAALSAQRAPDAGPERTQRRAEQGLAHLAEAVRVQVVRLTEALQQLRLACHRVQPLGELRQGDLVGAGMEEHPHQPGLHVQRQ